MDENKNSSLYSVLGKIVETLRNHPYLEFAIAVGLISILILATASNHIEGGLNINFLLLGFFSIAAIAMFFHAVTNVRRGNMSSTSEQRNLLMNWLAKLTNEQFRQVKQSYLGNNPDSLSESGYLTPAMFVGVMDARKQLTDLEDFLKKKYSSERP